MNTKTRVAIVFGGVSSEHVISCSTAAGVLSAIDRDKYEVVPVGITKEGQWVMTQDDADKLRIAEGRRPEVTLADGDPIKVGLGQETSTFVTVGYGQAGTEALISHEIDVVLPLLHGPYGEDGTIQGLFEMVGIPYVGSGVFSSSAAMDKHYMKVILQAADLPVGAYEVITDSQWRSNPGAAISRAEQLPFPVFVKPCRAGSSIGISKVNSKAGLHAAIEEARAHDPKVIIEAGIDGREIEVAVLDTLDGDPRTTLPGEIVVGGEHEFYTYEAKYFDQDAAELIWPSVLPEQVSQDAQALAIDAFEALSCEGLARVDLFYGADGNLYVNEINTMPGFTPFSMYPMMWQRSGMTYTELITELIELALGRPKGLR